MLRDGLHLALSDTDHGQLCGAGGSEEVVVIKDIFRKLPTVGNTNSKQEVSGATIIP